ncbi:inorganic pyrophosphatase [Natranaerofaba carboxydovora]|uniref:inorganic pyrophosphatase n=1 Tax=Natranaerofaba carboxydovora TaxID=2742683 RepID=UPI001F13DC3E|nr:inorganic pyrophosphatase [Natranaerofaba carboxydovora]UMZ74130.1 Inorganic pyrophosphatase [Natranaerofaba carboxydovora]
MGDQRFKAHPWHGVSIGENWPDTVNAFIEVVPSDTVKYELDKETGLLKIDRPQLYSNIYPSLYGMIPQTYCGDKVGDLCKKKTNQEEVKGDDDPLDICVLTEKIVPHGDILLQARPIGGFRLLDDGEADDKILSVLVNDALYGDWNDISDCPETVIRRLEHFFLTYKQMPEGQDKKCYLAGRYDKEEAFEVIRLSYEDYLDNFS